MINIKFDDRKIQDKKIIELSNAVIKIVQDATNIPEVFVYADSPRIKIGVAPIEIFVEMSASKVPDKEELFEEIKDLDVMMAPVGGGGLLSGTALAAKYFSPKTKVIAGEPAGSDDAYRSMQSGKIEQAQSQTIADGLLTTLGDKTFPIIKELVSEVIVCSHFFRKLAVVASDIYSYKIYFSPNPMG